MINLVYFYKKRKNLLLKYFQQISNNRKINMKINMKIILLIFKF